MKTAFVVCALALVCMSVTVNAGYHWDDDDSGKCDASSFDFFVFTRQWPSTNGCSGSLCQNYFTIHGMWPSNKDGSDPSYCGAKFNSDAIKSLETVMDKEWPSYQGENDSFWSHEFEKHGSCACNLPTMQTEFDFFNTTLVWHQQYNLMTALSKAGITPGSNSVSVDSITSAVTATYGGGATVQCTGGQLVSIEMCLDTNFSPMPCPSSGMQSTCTDSTVTFPSAN